MPQIGSFVQGIYRDESRTTGELVAALCKAALEYLPVELDEVGYRNGQTYRYASIHSIRRSTLAAHCKHGLFLNHVYTVTDKGECVTSVLRHTSGEYMSSTSPVAAIQDVQDAKAAKTLLCRTHSEGLLGIATERDDDGAAAVATDSASAETQGKQARTWEVVYAAISQARTLADVERLEATAIKRVQEGALAPGMEPEIKRVAQVRRDTLQEKTNADATTTDGTQGQNAAGSGSRGSNRAERRATAGT